MKNIFLLTCIMLASCATSLVGEGTMKIDRYGNVVHFDRGRTIQWSFDCSFPENVKKYVREGFQYWDDQTPVDLFDEMPCGTVDPTFGVVVFADYHDKDLDGTPVFGEASTAFKDGRPSGGIITLYRSFLKYCDEGTRGSTARHEVGHVLGFDHSLHGECLMYHQIEPEKVKFIGDLAPKEEFYGMFHYPKNLCQGERKMFQQLYGGQP